MKVRNLFTIFKSILVNPNMQNNFQNLKLCPGMASGLLPINKQFGVSLVELMVSMVLGLLMSGAVIQIYLSTKSTNKVSNGISRLQENARFGHYFITKDLRDGGNRGCLSTVRNKLDPHPPTEYLALLSSVSGWEYGGTAQGDSYIPPTTPVASGTGWTGNGNMPAFILNQAIDGTDVLRLQSLRKLDVLLKDNNNTTTNSLNTEGSHNVPDNSLLLVGNCSNADFFQHTSQGGGTQSSLTASQSGLTPGNDNLGPNQWATIYGPESSIFASEIRFYFIAIGTSGLPALFRVTASGSPLVETLSEELVEGVESMQFYYGEDLDADNNPNRYISASQVLDWEQIVSVRVGLLFRSADNISEIDQAPNYTLLDNITIAPSTDKVLRYAVNSTVKLRNRGLNGGFDDVFVCDAGTDC